MPEASKHVLLVEDEAPLRQAVAEQLTDRGYLVDQADSGEAAVARLSDFAFDIIITDLRLPGLDGSHVLEAALEQRRLRMENAYLRAQLEQRYSFAGIIGKSRAMTQLFQLLEPVAS